jgi:hypothetical protein
MSEQTELEAAYRCISELEKLRDTQQELIAAMELNLQAHKNQIAAYARLIEERGKMIAALGGNPHLWVSGEADPLNADLIG